MEEARGHTEKELEKETEEGNEETEGGAAKSVPSDKKGIY